MPAYDHETSERRWLFSQDRGGTYDLGIWSPLMLGFNLVEEALTEIRDLSISTATGVVLDLFGRLVGLNRGALADDEYRPAIVVEALSLFGSGDEGTISRLVRLIVGDLATVSITENGWGFNYWIPNLLPATAKLLGALLEDVHALTYIGVAITWDGDVVNFGSVHGPATVTGWFGSVHGPAVGEAGWAHAVPL